MFMSSCLLQVMKFKCQTNGKKKKLTTNRRGPGGWGGTSKNFSNNSIILLYCTKCLICPHTTKEQITYLFFLFLFQFPRQRQYWWCQNFHNLAPQNCFIYFIISFYKILNISNFILPFSEHLVCASISMCLWFFFLTSAYCAVHVP